MSSTAVAPRHSITELREVAEAAAASTLVPRRYQDRPDDVLIAMAHGAELGFGPLHSLQAVTVINGKPSLFGDSLVAVVAASPLCEGIEVEVAGEGDDRTATCTAHRRGWKAPVVRSFSVADAKVAGLWGKAGPWTQYPDRMLMARARGFALRDAFADLLAGVGVAEEQADIPHPTAAGTTALMIDTSGPTAVRDADLCREEQQTRIQELMAEMEIPADDLKEILARRGVAVVAELSEGQASDLIRKLEERRSSADVPF